MPAQLSFIDSRQLDKSSSRLFHRGSTPGDSRPEQVHQAQAPALAPSLDALHQAPIMVRDAPRAPMPIHDDTETDPSEIEPVGREPEASLPTRTRARVLPRSRHSQSPSPESGLVEIKYKPHTTTAQGFPVNNKVKKAKYATSIDNRGYLAVYEFQLNDQTIMWDYSSGIVHLTGIWKALGNSKADIVRLVDNHPELEGVIRRIRGGFLKIQGTWVPYELCRRLAIRTCYPIRHALISVFGPSFPDECLKPGTKGYGTLTLDDSAIDKQRKKRKIIPGTKVDLFKTSASSPPRIGVRQRRPRMAHAPRARRSSVLSSSSASSAAGSTPTIGQKSLDKKSSPPPIPQIVDLETNGFCPSHSDLLDLLRASRSLQKISAGADGEWTQQGGRFNLNGTNATFQWDGSDTLDVVDHETFESSPQMSSESWDMPPGMTRNFSTHSGDCFGPLTPPPTYQDLNVVSIRHVPSIPEPYVPGAAAPVAPVRRPQEWRGKEYVGSAPFEVLRPKPPMGPQIKTLGIDLLRSW